MNEMQVATCSISNGSGIILENVVEFLNWVLLPPQTLFEGTYMHEFHVTFEVLIARSCG